MEIEDIFENKSRYRRYEHHNDSPEHRYQHRHRGNYSHVHPAFNIISKIWHNPKLRLFFILAVIIVLALIVLVLITIIPFIFKLLDSIAQTGLKDAVGIVTEYLEKLWNGSGS